MKIIDIRQLIDDARSEGFWKLLFGTTLTMVLSGLNSVVSEFSRVQIRDDRPQISGDRFFLETIGLMAGAILGGMCGDRIGRRRTLLWSVIAFSAPVLAMAAVNDVAMLGLLRVLSAVGRGIATANAAALAYEYAPRKKRDSAVIVTMTGISIAGLLLAVGVRIGGVDLPQEARVLFILVGIVSVLAAVMLFRILPESPIYLVSRGERRPELVATMRRYGHDLPADAISIDSEASYTGTPARSIRGLFAPPLLLNTVGLLVSFFACMLAVTVTRMYVVRVVPNAVIQTITGPLLAAFIVWRFGSRLRIFLLGLSAASILCAIVLIAFAHDAPLAPLWVNGIHLLGGLVSAAQMTAFALAASTFPSEVRARGIGAAAAVSRMGLLLAPALVPAPYEPYNTLGVAAIGMTVSLFSLTLVRHRAETEGWTVVDSEERANRSPRDTKIAHQ